MDVTKPLHDKQPGDGFGWEQARFSPLLFFYFSLHISDRRKPRPSNICMTTSTCRWPCRWIMK